MNKKINQKKINIKRKQIDKVQTIKKRIFILITLGILIAIFSVFEITLRLVNYEGNLRLFIPATTGYENYYRCNPDVAKRYFFIQNTIPSPPKDLFLREKPGNVFRIFVMGGSTTAGFPYGNNVMFSRILGNKLENVYPEQKFEVINVAMSAINSYTLLDFIDEIIAQKPDLILIYAGHNEYYGALGVGSVESISNQRWLIKTSLYLQKFKSFIFFRNAVVKIKMWISTLGNDKTQSDPAATLMERIVAEQTIPLGSDLYKAGKAQFQTNLYEILEKTKAKKIPVILSELISNVRDQVPFISLDDQNHSSAVDTYRNARILENQGKFTQAKSEYYKAKDLDALRFRAPEEFNEILDKLAKQFQYPIIPMKTFFEKYSPHGIIGNTLVLEHLHPNIHGYYIMAMAFLDSIIKSGLIQPGHQSSLNIDIDYQSFLDSWGFTDLDKVCAELTIENLKNGWPFKAKDLPNTFLRKYQPKNLTEQVVLKILKDPNFGLEMGHLELAKYYEEKHDLDNAYKEYYSLICTIPNEIDFYVKTATDLLMMKKYPEAQKILLQSLQYKESFFAIKWLGQIALLMSDYNKAIYYLEKGRFIDSNDAQLLFNLGRAYYHSGKLSEGDNVLEQLGKVNPNSAYFKNLQNLSNIIREKIN